MKCPFCAGEVPLPPKEIKVTECLACFRRFKDSGDDYGWFTYSVQVFLPEDEDDS